MDVRGKLTRDVPAQPVRPAAASTPHGSKHTTSATKTRTSKSRRGVQRRLPQLEPVHTTFYTATGAKDAVLTAQRGTYNSRTTSMLARKNVVVVSEDGRRLTTPELRYNQQMNEISSDSAFVMTEPNRRLEGIGFRSDPNMKNIQILKNASGMARGISTQPAPGVPPTAAPNASRTAPPTAPPAASSTPKR